MIYGPVTVFHLERKVFQAAVPMSIAAFLLLMSYAFVRPATNSLFKGAYGASNMPIVMGLVVFGVMMALWIYSRLLSYFGPRRTLLYTSVGSALLLALHYIAIENGIRLATGSLYVLKGSFIVLIIEQYWSFLNSKLDAREAKKVFGVILGISTLGGVLGHLISAEIVVEMGSEKMILLGAICTLFAGFVSDFCYQISGEPEYKALEQKRTKDKLGLKLFKEHRSLCFILLVILLTQIIAGLVTLKFHLLLENEFADTALQNQYESKFWSVTESAGLGVNFILTPFLLNFLSLRVIHFLIPGVHLIAIGAMLLNPNLWTASVAFCLFKSIDYSLFRAAKEILYIPYSFDVRYRAKQVIDVFGYRLGKAGMSLVIVGFQAMGIALASLYGWIALGGVALWLMAVPGLTRAPDIRPKSKDRAA